MSLYHVIRAGVNHGAFWFLDHEVAIVEVLSTTGTVRRRNIMGIGGLRAEAERDKTMAKFAPL